jgi:hypothetical protein
MEIIRTDLETNKVELISIDLAIHILSNYWIKEKIKDMLILGNTLNTPFATYQINN